MRGLDSVSPKGDAERRPPDAAIATTGGWPSAARLLAALGLAVGLTASGWSLSFAAGPGDAPAATDSGAVNQDAGQAADDAAPAAATGFAGTWDTVNGDNHKFTMTLADGGDGKTVSGPYRGNGGSGSIAGEVGPDGKLVFQWSQQGFAGTGVFELDQDGKTFSGTFSKSDDPAVIDGSWFGTRVRKPGP